MKYGITSLVLGTHNRKKREELAELLRPVGLMVHTLEDFAHAIVVEEDGQTFAENAQKKAREQALHLGYWVLGEDSGLVVPALNGAPGVYSAYFSGPQATDDSNNALLLQRMQGLPREKRQAYYVCHVSLSDPRGEIVIDLEDTCHGVIRESPAGSHGFGYDPLFEIPEYGRTFGELGPGAKRLLSHRGRALRRLVQGLT